MFEVSCIFFNIPFLSNDLFSFEIFDYLALIFTFGCIWIIHTFNSGTSYFVRMYLIIDYVYQYGPHFAQRTIAERIDWLHCTFS